MFIGLFGEALGIGPGVSELGGMGSVRWIEMALVSYFFRFRCHWVLRWDFCFYQNCQLIQSGNTTGEHFPREFCFVGRPWVKLWTPFSLPCAWPRGWNLRPFTSCNMQMATRAMEGRDSVTIRFHALWMEAWYYLSPAEMLKCHNAIMSYSLTIYYDKLATVAG